MRLLEPGEYVKHNRVWYARPDSCSDKHMIANLNYHTVTEHDDGTISVSPSILIQSHDGKRWHGYLQQGVWSKLGDSNV